MKKINKKRQGYLTDLKSKNDRIVLSAIQKLRSVDEAENVLYIVELMCIHTSKAIVESCISFLNDVKSDEAVPLFIDAIKNDRNRKGLYNIVSACWQNSLDFSNHFMDFIDLVIREDYLIAFEAFTVIESMHEDLSTEQVEQGIGELKKAILVTKDDKKPLISELIRILTNAEYINFDIQK